MLLYKYYSYEAGVSALKSRRLGFRRPGYFNDPFELSGMSNAIGYAKISSRVGMLKDGVGVLSLTRTPLNPLMWSHYAIDHKGFVIGYDVSVDFLSSDEWNIVPVQDGDVIYTSSKDRFLIGGNEKTIFHEEFLAALGEPSSEKGRRILKRVLLYKHSCWSYEEEVRVVKLLDSPFFETSEWMSEPNRIFDIPTEPICEGRSKEKISGLCLFKTIVPIKEVYIGLRNPSRTDFGKLESCLECKASKPVFYQMFQAENSWELRFEQIDI